MSLLNLTGSCRRNRQVNPVTGGKMLFAGAGLFFGDKAPHHLAESQG